MFTETCDYTFCHGPDTELLDLCEGCTAVVLPAYQETSPVAVLQSMAAAWPVIATPVGGVPDLIKDDVTGFLVPPGKPDVLADAICQLWGDSELCSRLA